MIESAIITELIYNGFPLADAESISNNITTSVSIESRCGSIKVSKNTAMAKRNIEIRELYYDSAPVDEIASIYGVSQRTVYDIIQSEKKYES